PWKHPYRAEIYYERPGDLCLITAEDESGTETIGERLFSEAGKSLEGYEARGVRFEPRVCLIRCPEDLQTAEDNIALGHKFQIIAKGAQSVRASDLVHTKDFAVEVHIEDILDRAIRDEHIEVFYQPIYDLHSESFHSAEALARIIDPEYGPISPGVFIPAAEKQGFIIPIGDAVLEQVFRFLAKNDPDALGLNYVDVNLSVAQCMERSLPEKIGALQKKYGVDPSRIMLEITETIFENISDVMLENVSKLIDMGYSFALDDYGIGYSSIQRINHIPLKIVKIDKSMLDAVSSENGKTILEHTVRMMQSIGKQIVVEGAETADEVALLQDMHCECIQGFYYSYPLPADRFTRFMERMNAKE
ncbi:MAG: EAL domain-containing protein, partial [Oscillibacter sp.]|nr:EAL domain-containing protein [Oscillibacter sp.]